MPTDRLVLRWGKADRRNAPDLVCDYPDHPTTANLVFSMMAGHIGFDELIRDLEERGYDTKTLRLTVRKRQGGTTTKEGESDG